MARRFQKALFSAAVLVGFASTAHAIPITGLFNTGVDDLGDALAGGISDPHFTIVDPAGDGIVVKDGIPGTWIANTATYRWIWQTVDGLPTFVTLTFETTFDLTGLNPTTASIMGEWATDNEGLDILINGFPTGNTCAGFRSFCAFSVNSHFIAGMNTLSFEVEDRGVISGFLVGAISGSADKIPEPGTLALFGLGLLGLGLARRRGKTA